MAAVKGQRWCTILHQIPPTVIDKGVLRNIPYASFASGNHEINIYGDPEKPCCVEIGLYANLLNDKTARQDCVEYMGVLLVDPADRQLLRVLSLQQDLKVREGLTFEVTPETAEDAYGGWWISIYDEAAVEKSRASPEELASITVARGEIAGTGVPSVVVPRVPTGPAELDWTAADLSRSRRVYVNPTPSSGRVYVRSYTRKDGTYVSAHTRARPRR